MGFISSGKHAQISRWDKWHLFNKLKHARTHICELLNDVGKVVGKYHHLHLVETPNVYTYPATNNKETECALEKCVSVIKENSSEWLTHTPNVLRKEKKVETTSSVITNRTNSSTFTLRAQDNTRRPSRSNHTQGTIRGIQRGEKQAKLLQRKMWKSFTKDC